MSSSGIGEMALYALAVFVILFLWAAWVFFSGVDLVSGFFEPGDSWLDWIAWAFRSIGLIIGLLMLAILPFWASKAQKYDYSGLYSRHRSISQSEPPNDLPAAAVSVLENRKVTSQTVKTIVFDMCQSGVLRITFDAISRQLVDRHGVEWSYDVKWSSGSQSKFDWENTVLEFMERNDFNPNSDQFQKTISRQLSEYLQNRGIFDGDPISAARWVYMLWVMGPVLFVGALIAWMVFADAHLLAEFIIVIVLVPPYLIGLFFVEGFEGEERITRASKRGPTEKGLEEIVPWMAFKRHLRQMKPSAGAKEQPMPYPFCSYAIALGRDEEWMFSGIADSLMGNSPISETIGKGDTGEEVDLDSVFMRWLYTLSVSGRGLEDHLRVTEDFQREFELN